MKALFSLLGYLIFLLPASTAQNPVKYDDRYQTIYAKDLCRIAQLNKDLVLIDVRSPGEFSDTSQYASLNLGHLKGAINIGIDSMQKNMAMMDQYKNKTLVLYCSHSQRSRRVSKLLSENGFTHFYNLNGGMSYINQMTETSFPCKKEWLVSNLPFHNLSVAESADLIMNQPGLVIVDVRPAPLFESKDSLVENNIGKIKNAINIPYSEFKQRIKELDKYKTSPILLYASSGDGDAARAAADLTTAGFTKIYHLVGGLDDMMASQDKLSIFADLPPFRLVNSRKMLQMIKDDPALVIYDTRPAAEFENKVTGMESYKNLGNVKKAIHLEEKDFAEAKFPANKNAKILIYGHAEAYRLAHLLKSRGFTDVNLHPGLYEFIWSAFNIEECKDDLKYLENHEGLY